MENALLTTDPYNVIITGVGGQGNVMASRILGKMLSLKGLDAVIGETFGASQRGGSVMSHLRISSEGGWSPQIPKGRAHMVVALEPIEALRVLKDYGAPETMVICNSRPIHSVGVICGEHNYPSFDDITKWLEEMTVGHWFIGATDEAMKLGHPIFGNIILIGALAGVGVLPLDRGDFETVLSQTMSADKVEVNLKAFDIGTAMTAS